jgi:glutamyl-Q tRNA(Asp) synthetase
VSYVGRFAPSPTGPLHIGSLATAVASFLHARQARGEWLVRIEDIDPPREVPGAADSILRTLDALELASDRPVLLQSTRLDAYREAAEALLAAGRAYYCRCSRSEIRADNEGQSARYPGTCRERNVPPGDAAIRVRVEPGPVAVVDGLQGPAATDLAAVSGDYVIVRRDGLPAYHLAVVLDDAEQGVTTIVRGVDLLESTAAHVHLQRVLGLPTLQYYHLPVVVDEEGQKLSKQTGARAVDPGEPRLAARILALLGLDVPTQLAAERPSVLWQWALTRWNVDSLRGRREVRLAPGAVAPGTAQ